LRKIIPFLLVLALTAYGQQTSVAVLPSDANGAVLNNDELEALTDKMRETALKVLPTNAFVLLKQDVVIKRLGGAEKYIKECSESSCIVDLGKKAQVDYVSQASVGKLGNKIRLKVELYSVRTEGLVGMLNGEAENIEGLLDIVEKRIPTEVFSKIPGASGRKSSAPSFAGGIGGVQTAGGGYELDEKLYLVNLNTDPRGAILSFDGVASAKCKQTPCKLELRGGNVRIIANLEQYEIADTTVFVSYNNQSIDIRLKSNFGILEIKPAYLENIGINEPWNLTISGKAASSWENKLSPGKYKVELSHRCYEALSFEAGINKGSREVFDMTNNIMLKKGGLILSAERGGEPISESVFVNGKHVGETPFSGAVPLCSKIEVGYNREAVNVELKYNEKVTYTYKSNPYAPVFSEEPITAYLTQEDAIPVPEFEKPIKNSFWVALGLDLLGVAIISVGVVKNQDVSKAVDKYNVIEQSPEYYTDARKEVENKRSIRNTLYVIGGVLLTSGIGVHIWF